MSLISKQMRAFMTVAEAGSFRNASTILSLTVSPVSRMITDFENYYKQKLFIRKGNGVELTKEGKKLHQTLYPLYIELSQVENDMRNANGAGRNLNIYHDWGKDWLIYNLLQRVEKNKVYKKISVKNIEMDKNEVRHRDESVYLFSREYYMSGCHLLEKLSAPRMVLVTGRANGRPEKEKTLILSEEQKLNPIINEYVNRMRVEGEITSVMTLCSDNIMKQYIYDGKGFSLLPEDYENMMCWNEFNFKPMDCKYNLNASIFVYVPISQSGGSAMEVSLKETIRKNYTRDDYINHSQSIKN